MSILNKISAGIFVSQFCLLTISNYFSNKYLGDAIKTYENIINQQVPNDTAVNTSTDALLALSIINLSISGLITLYDLALKYPNEAASLKKKYDIFQNSLANDIVIHFGNPESEAESLNHASLDSIITDLGKKAECIEYTNISISNRWLGYSTLRIILATLQMTFVAFSIADEFEQIDNLKENDYLNFFCHLIPIAAEVLIRFSCEFTIEQQKNRFDTQREGLQKTGHVLIRESRESLNKALLSPTEPLKIRHQITSDQQLALGEYYLSVSEAKDTDNDIFANVAISVFDSTPRLPVASFTGMFGSITRRLRRLSSSVFPAIDPQDEASTHAPEIRV